jgi:hypothetical protein
MSALPQEVAARSEVDLAADVVAELLVSGFVKGSNADDFRRLARCVGIPVEAIRIAVVNRRTEPYVIPRGRTDRQPVSQAPGPVRLVTKQVGTARRRRMVTRIDNDQEVRRCSRCHEWLPIDQFDVKDKRTGRRWSVDRACKADYQRERYLHASKAKALNAARLEFRLGEDDDVELICTVCEKPLHVGDQVVGETELAHVTCASSR